MSKQIDERVVSMQFDNKHFESNVATSMSTLDKLKAKLNLSGASKGLENVGAAAKKVDMSPLSQGVETVGLKFNAMYTIADQALRNITNSAMNAGKKIVSALTIDPVTSGFQEYETQMNAVQTILANTQSKGSTLDDVNKALDTLNTYADKTIYNFTEMTRNIGTFTAAGVDLQTSVDSIQGIANLAAVSGSSSQQASTAMYQLSQALAAGKVSLTDWNSVVNAGMGGELFQNALLRTSELLKTGGKEAVKTYGSFRESLTKGEWLTKEVLTETLKQLSGAYTEADLIAQGFTEEQAKEITKLADTATDAATKVKTFTQLWDVLKEAAQSGWSKTWKIIIGDFEEAKALLTPLADFLTGAINKMSDWRNNLLEGALGRTFTDLSEKIKGILTPINKTTETVKGMVDGLKDYGKVVDEIIGGKWGNGQARWDDLTKAGYDWAHAQNLVNEKLGDSTRHATNYTEAQKEQVTSTTKLAEADAERLEQLMKLSDAELEAMGYTKDQISALRELESITNKLGMSVGDFLANMDEMDGRWILINSFKNIGQGLVAVLKAVKDAWVDIFPPMTSDQLFNIIAGFHKLTTHLRVSDENADKFKRTFKGVFAILDIVLTIIGGPIKIAFKILTQLLGAFNLNILDVTAAVGDAIVKFRDWIDKTLNFTAIFKAIVPYVKAAVTAIRNWFKAFKESDAMQKVIAQYNKAIDGIRKWIDSLKGSDNIVRDVIVGIANGLVKGAKLIDSTIANLISGIGESFKSGNAGKYVDVAKNVISGLVTGLKEGAKIVGSAIWELGKSMITKICDVLGIHSPSKEMEEVGKWSIQGLVKGIQNGASAVWNAIKNVALKAVEVIKKIDFGALLAAATAVGMTVAANKIGTALVNFSAPFEGLGDFLENVGEGINKNLKADALKKKADALKSLAIAIGILVAAIYVLTRIDDPGKLWGAIGAIAVLSAILIGLSLAIGKLNGVDTATLDKTGLNVKKTATSIIPMAIALLLVASAVSKLGKLSIGELLKGGITIAALGGILVGLMAATKLVGKDIDKTTAFLIKISLTMTLLVFTIKQISKLEPGELAKGLLGIALFGGIIVGLMAATKLAGNSADKLGSTIFKISAAILLLVLVAKILGRSDPEVMIKGLAFIVAFGYVVAGLILAVRLAGGNNIAKIGSTLIAISVAMLLMAGIATILGRMDTASLIRGVAAVTALGVIVAGLIFAVKSAGGEAKGIATSILAISIAIGILAAIAVLLSLVSLEHLVKGEIAVGILAAMMVVLIKATENAQQCVGTIVALTVVISILVASVILLSFIDPAKVATASVALSLVMGMFALLIGVTQKIKTGAKTWVRTIVTLTALMAIVAGLAQIIAQLSKCDPNSALGASASLSLLLISLTTSLQIMSKSKAMKPKNLGMALLGLLALTGVMAALGLVLAMMSALKVENAMTNAVALSGLLIVLTVVATVLAVIGGLWQNILLGSLGLAALTGVMALLGLVLAMMSALKVKNAMENATALSQLLLTMTVVAAVLAVIGAATTNILLGALGLAALTGVMALLGLVLAMMSALKVENALENAKALSILLLAMGTVCAIVAVVGPAAMVGVGGLYALVGFMLVVGALAVAIGALVDKFPILETFLDKGIDIFVKLASGIGKIIGSFITGFANEVMTILPNLGTCLSQFMTNLNPFIAGAKMIDDTVATGIGILVGAMLGLTATNFISGITQLSPFIGSFAKLGTQLSEFATNALPFIYISSLIKPESMNGVKTLAETILVITAANILDGIMRFVTGSSSLQTFGKELSHLGTGLKNFITTLGPVTDEQVATAGRAADIIKTLAKASSEIPNAGGALAALVGDNEMGTWAAQMPIMAKGIVDFTKTLIDAKITSDSVGLAKKAAEIIEVLAGASSEIPNAGGMLKALVGDNEMGTWAAQMPKVGKGIAGFTNALVEGDITEESVSLAKKASSIIKVLATASAEIPNMGHCLESIIGKKDMSTWAAQMPKVGKGVAGFAKELGTFSEEKVATVKAGTEAVKVMANMSKNYGSVKDAGDFGSFGDGMVKLAGKIKEFANAMVDVGKKSLDSAVKKTKELIDLAKSTAKTSVKSLGTFGESLKSLAKDGVNGFVKEFTKKSPKEDVKKAAKAIMESFNKGADDKKDSVKKKGKALAEAFTDALDTKSIIKEAKTAGKNVAQGFADGIKNNKSLAKDAGSALGKAALKAAKEALDENSPSKEMYKIGDFAGIGFVKALYDNVSAAYYAGKDVANSAKNGISTAISRITDMVNSDIDAQPTIRPVLDLSDVRAGAGSINALFSGRTLSVNTSSVGAISASMAGIQNGRNSEVVSAIKGLRKDIANMPRNITNVNGVTYDDGTNVSNAVGSLVRELRIQRRT